MSDVRPHSAEPFFEGDMDWDGDFPEMEEPDAMAITAERGSDTDSDCDEVYERIGEVNVNLDYQTKALQWWKEKVDVHGKTMEGLKVRINEATKIEMKNTIVAERRFKKLLKLEHELSRRKTAAVREYKQDTEFTRDRVQHYKEGFELFRDYAMLVDPNHRWELVESWAPAHAVHSADPANHPEVIKTRENTISKM